MRFPVAILTHALSKPFVSGIDWSVISNHKSLLNSHRPQPLFEANRRTSSTFLTFVQVIERVRRKSAIYGQDLSNIGQISGSSGALCNGDGAAAGAQHGGSDGSEDDSCQYRILPEVVATLYDRWVMPLTKEVEVLYLLRRLESDL